MNCNLIAFTVLMVFLAIGCLVMLYFQWLDGYVRKWRWEKEIETSSTTNGQPTITWVLEAKIKELTDDEMYELLEKYQGIELCKAVLRKAQEK